MALVDLFVPESSPVNPEGLLRLAPLETSQYPLPAMDQDHLKNIATPVVLGLAVATALGFGLRFDLQAPVRPQPTVQEQAGPQGLWRCHACARIRGKNWTPCRTVTGRGTKRSAQDLAQVRVCSEAANPETDCRIVRMDCQQLEDASSVPAKRMDIEPGAFKRNMTKRINESLKRGRSKRSSKAVH